MGRDDSVMLFPVFKNLVFGKICGATLAIHLNSLREGASRAPRNKVTLFQMLKVFRKMRMNLGESGVSAFQTGHNLHLALLGLLREQVSKFMKFESGHRVNVFAVVIGNGAKQIRIDLRNFRNVLADDLIGSVFGKAFA